MKKRERLNRRRQVDRTRCPECRGLHLELQDVKAMFALCPKCGWSGRI